MKVRNRALGVVGVTVLSVMIRLLCLTYRKRIVDPHGLIEKLKNDPDMNVALGVWHNRLIFCIALCPKFIRRRVVAMSSQSKDGDLSALYAKLFGLTVVRGSSSRNGANALKAILKLVRKKYHVALTLDGPRGPLYEAQPGAGFLAGACKIPLIPASVNSDNYWVVNSWDRMQIPKPFSKVELVFGEPLMLPPRQDKDQQAAKKARVEEAMKTVTVDLK